MVKANYKSIVIFLIFLFLLSMSISGFVEAQPTNRQVTTDNMRDYAQTLITTYIQEVYQYFPSTWAYWTFWPSTFYNSTVYISSTKGAALLIEPSNISDSYLKEVNTEKTVEIAVFGGNPNLQAWIPQVGGATMFTGGLHEPLGDSPFIDLTFHYSSMLVQNMVINRTNSLRYYYFVDIKASNSLDFWTTDVAKAQANKLVYNDAGQWFFNSSDFVQLIGIPECSSQLENLRANIATNTPAQSRSQWIEIQNVAQQFGVNSTILNQLVDFANAGTTGLLPTFPPNVEPTPTATTPLTIKPTLTFYDWIAIFGVSLVVSLSTLVFLTGFYYVKKKMNNELYKIIADNFVKDSVSELIGLGALVGYCVLTYTFNSVWDIPFLILDVAAGAAVGVVIILLLSRLFPHPFRNKNHDSAHSHSKTKTGKGTESSKRQTTSD